MARKKAVPAEELEQAGAGLPETAPEGNSVPLETEMPGDVPGVGELEQSKQSAPASGLDSTPESPTGESALEESVVSDAQPEPESPDEPPPEPGETAGSETAPYSVREDRQAVGADGAEPKLDLPAGIYGGVLWKQSDHPPAPPERKTDRQLFYETNFNELDRGLTPAERQEWNSIYASYRGGSALTGTIIGVDPEPMEVLNRKTGKMETQTVMCAAVIPYRVKIVIPATEMWADGSERPEYVLRNVVGATIDFIITKVRREDGRAEASRRLAMRARRYYFSHRPALNSVGTRLKCRLMSVGPRRCLVECYGHDIDLTQRELRYTAIPDLRTEYHPGQELDCVVTSYIPEMDSLRISVKETESNPFDGAQLRHPVGSRRQAMISGKYGGGVFCNLPDGTVCMCSYSYQFEDSDFMVGDTVILVVQRYDDEKKQMYGKILSKW